MYMFKYTERFNSEPTGHGDRNTAEKYLCPLCGKRELMYEDSMPAVYVSPAPKDFMYCHGCERWIAVI